MGRMLWSLKRDAAGPSTQKKVDASANRFRDAAVSAGPMKNGGLPRIYREDGQRVYRLGERESGSSAKKDLQDFTTLREQCLARGVLFEDADFPAVESSLYHTSLDSADEKKLPTLLLFRLMKWRRPGEITAIPQLFVKGLSRFDAKQGKLGNCWMVASVAHLAMRKTLFYQVVPDDQSFDQNYAGIFHFRFWQFGRWVDVVIDDRLPFDTELAFLHSTDKNEFWGALLEKAYAKLYGSYEAIEFGLAGEAMVDFTGGISELYFLKEIDLNVIEKVIIQGYRHGSIMSAGTRKAEGDEDSRPQGIPLGHGYTITAVVSADLKAPCNLGQVLLIRMRNPWGNEVEWTGAWSDKSPEWNCVSNAYKKKIGLTFEDDGEFWISLKDFSTHFKILDICHLNPGIVGAYDLPKGRNETWMMNTVDGEWVENLTAGGCKPQTVSQNPRYTLILTERDEGSDEDLCTVIVALMQKYRRVRHLESMNIAHLIYKQPKPEQMPLPQDFFTRNDPVAHHVLDLRDVAKRFRLPPGTYFIIPATVVPNQKAEFLLRVFTEKAATLVEQDEEIGLGPIDNRVLKVTSQQTPPDELKKFFVKIAGPDGEVDWLSLKAVLDYAMNKETQGHGFSNDICRSMVAMMDSDGSGKLDFDEFTNLWTDLQKWKAVFRLYDTKEAGRIPVSFLRSALRSSGYTVNNRTLNILVHRYGSRDGFIAFDDFTMCVVRLKALLDTFYGSADPKTMLSATFTLEDWLRKTIYS